MPMRIIGKTSIDFIGLRRISFYLSAFLVLAGLYSLVMIFSGRGTLGIEFAGGTMVQGNFDSPVEIGEMRRVMSEAGFDDATIQELQRDVANSYVIRTRAAPGKDVKVGVQIEDALRAAFADNEFHLDSIHEVGPAIGKELRQDAGLAILVSLVGILLYIALRFDFRFGVAATIATFHDVMTVLAVVYFLDKEITILVISALLTLAGYSLTDTVVVFDRIRENLKKLRRKSQFVDGVNLSINDVLSRTVITSLTSLLVVVVLFIAGGEVLRDFAMALICGIVIGTYSSVFVASPVYVEWENRRPRRFK